MKIVGFVPARGGSVGIKNKNLAMLNNKPLISYTLEILKKLKKDIIPFISTDSLKIKKYSEEMGFRNDYLRPKNLSRSSSNVADAVIHACDWLEKNKHIKADAILLLQPTSPIRYLNEIQKAINLFKRKKMDSLISVSPIKEHPFESIEIQKKGKWKFLKSPNKNVFRRQQFSKNIFYIDGNFYLVKLSFLKKYRLFVKKSKTSFFKLKRSWPVDIDDREDLAVASALLKI